jgi:hypothetical protein
MTQNPHSPHLTVTLCNRRHGCESGHNPDTWTRSVCQVCHVTHVPWTSLVSPDCNPKNKISDSPFIALIISRFNTRAPRCASPVNIAVQPTDDCDGVSCVACTRPPPLVYCYCNFRCFKLASQLVQLVPFNWPDLACGQSLLRWPVTSFSVKSEFRNSHHSSVVKYTLCHTR